MLYFRLFLNEDPKRETHQSGLKRNATSKRNILSAPASNGPFPLPFIPTSSGSRLDFPLPAVRLAKYDVCSGRSLATKRDRATT